MSPLGTAARVAVLASRVGPEEKRLLEALERRGVTPVQVDVRRMWRTAGEPEPLHASTGTVVLNREISFTRALHAALSLEAAGARVFNRSAATEICGDKWRGTLALRAAGLPVPDSALALTPEAALAALDSIGYPAVFKPLTGSWGRLVTPIPDRRTAETVLEYIAALPGPASHLVYIQRQVDKPGRDIRVLVLGGEAVAAEYRVSADWRTNISRGGRAEHCPLDEQTAKLAIAAAGAVGAELAGVDLIEDAEGAQAVLEVNHRVEFTGLQAAAGDRVDIAGRIADRLVAEAAR